MHRTISILAGQPLKNTAKTSNLAAALIALDIAAFILLAAAVGGAYLEHRYVHVLAPILFLQKTQGIELQKVAFEQSDLLPLYGSSELVVSAANKATDFFQTYPTRFGVFSVGKPGSTSLILLQKLAAMGSDLRGKKVAISISPTYFFRQDVPVAYYNGNFSLLQAGEIIYSPYLSFDLKRDVARRMLQYPKTLEKSALLAFTLRQLASGSPMNRVAYYGTVPLGLLENGFLRIVDHCEMLLFILKRVSRLPLAVTRSQRTVDWEGLIADANARVRRHNHSDTASVGAEKGPEMFVAGEENAQEWIDFELLLRGLNELGARPLVLSMPIDGRYFDRFGVGRPFRDLYYKRIRGLAQIHQIPLLDFEEHDLDEDFLVAHRDHLTDKGWLYFDKALDDFFHQRLVLPPSASTLMQ
jgi:D-alanine transfer protein